MNVIRRERRSAFRFSLRIMPHALFLISPRGATGV